MMRVKYTGKTPEYPDGFPEKCERSCKGAIHLLPQRQLDITEDELKFIRKKYPKLKLVEVPKEKPVAKLKMPLVTQKTSGLKSEKKPSGKESSKKPSEEELALKNEKPSKLKKKLK
jgi:hypothetical protein